MLGVVKLNQKLFSKVIAIGSCESIFDQRKCGPTDVILRYDPVEVNWEMMGGVWVDLLEGERGRQGLGSRQAQTLPDRITTFVKADDIAKEHRSHTIFYRLLQKDSFIDSIAVSFLVILFDFNQY